MALQDTTLDNALDAPARPLATLAEVVTEETDHPWDMSTVPLRSAASAIAAESQHVMVDRLREFRPKIDGEARGTVGRIMGMDRHTLLWRDRTRLGGRAGLIVPACEASGTQDLR